MADVATELEAPFGRDENDVDFEKMLRRIDKHTASQLSLRIGRPVANFDIFSEFRKTDGANKEITGGPSKRRSSVTSLYLESEKSQGPVGKWFSDNFHGSVIVAGNGNEFFVEQETRLIEEKEREALMRLQEDMSKARKSTWKAVGQIAKEQSKARLELPSRSSSPSASPSSPSPEKSGLQMDLAGKERSLPSPEKSMQVAAAASQVKLAVQVTRSLREESVTLQRKASASPPLMPPERPTDAPTDKPSHREHDVAGTSGRLSARDIIYGSSKRQSSSSQLA